MNRGRLPELRIDDIDSHPKRFVAMCVAAEFLEVDVRTLRKWIREGLIAAVPFGKHHRIPLAALKAFHVKITAA